MSENNNQHEIGEILRMLPHRYPFVLVDRVLDVTMGESIKVLKNVTINEPFFQGHFPVEPVMPGVLIMEGLAQAGILLVYLTEPEKVSAGLIYFAGMDKVRFRRKVVPGDQLIYELRILKQKSRVVKLEAKAYVDGKLAAEGELLATLA